MSLNDCTILIGNPEYPTCDKFEMRFFNNMRFEPDTLRYFEGPNKVQLLVGDALSNFKTVDL